MHQKLHLLIVPRILGALTGLGKAGLTLIDAVLAALMSPKCTITHSQIIKFLTLSKG